MTGRHRRRSKIRTLTVWITGTVSVLFLISATAIVYVHMYRS